MKPHVYAMVTTKKSNHYTTIALESFFKNTQLGKLDQFYLIDNDACNIYKSNRYITIENPVPLNFSQNINQIINISQDRDIFFLNNDIVFTPNWNTALIQYDNVISIPACNQTHFYKSKNLQLNLTMYIDEFNNNFTELNDISKFHIKSSTINFFEMRLMPFYAFRLPKKIYIKVGLFDETFSVGGEDVDYRIRCLQNGFSVKYTNSSYLLHFHGKSSWDNEDAKETLIRNQLYEEVFLKKWGQDCFDFCLNGKNFEPVIKKYKFEQLVNEQKFSEVIKALVNIQSNLKDIA